VHNLIQPKGPINLVSHGHCPYTTAMPIQFQMCCPISCTVLSGATVSSF